MKKTKKEILKWLDMQIEATKKNGIPLYADDPFYVNNAGGYSADVREIHIYGIERLAKDLHRHLLYKPFDTDNEYAYFTYKKYEIFGIVPKRKETKNEGE